MVVGSLSLLLLRHDNEAAVGGLVGRHRDRVGRGPHRAVARDRAAAVAME